MKNCTDKKIAIGLNVFGITIMIACMIMLPRIWYFYLAPTFTNAWALGYNLRKLKEFRRQQMIDDLLSETPGASNVEKQPFA